MILIQTLQLISRFGFKDADAIRRFLLTPAGDTVKSNMTERVANDKAIEEENRRLHQEEIAQEELMRAYLMLWMASKDDKEKAERRALVDEQNQEAIKRSQEPSAAGKHDAHTKETLKKFDAAIEACQTAFNNASDQLQALDARVTHFTQQQQAFNTRSELYMQQIGKLDLIATELTSDDRKVWIKALEQQIAEMDEQFMSVTDDDELRALVDEQTALRIQLAHLKDLEAGKVYYGANGELMLDNDGNPTSIGAMFVLDASKGQRIVKEGNTYYLLEQGQELTDETRPAAQQAFNKAKLNILTVKETVKDTLKAEKAFHEDRIKTTTTERDVAQAKKDALGQEMSSLQVTRDSIAKQGVQLGTAPRPAPFPKDPLPSVVGIIQKLISKNFFNILLGPGAPGISPNDLGKKIDQHVENQEDAKKIKDIVKEFLEKLCKGQILSFAPLPDETMKALLKNMNGFGADQYQANRSLDPKAGIIPEMGSPTNSTTTPGPFDAPTPFRTDPTK